MLRLVYQVDRNYCINIHWQDKICKQSNQHHMFYIQCLSIFCKFYWSHSLFYLVSWYNNHLLRNNLLLYKECISINQNRTLSSLGLCILYKLWMGHNKCYPLEQICIYYLIETLKEYIEYNFRGDYHSKGNQFVNIKYIYYYYHNKSYLVYRLHSYPYTDTYQIHTQCIYLMSNYSIYMQHLNIQCIVFSHCNKLNLVSQRNIYLQI